MPFNTLEIGRDEKNQPIHIMPDSRWSFQDFTNQKNIFVGRAKELPGIVIYKSCFYQEGKPDQDVFPSDVKNLTLVWCNLDNVRVPAGVTLISCTQRRIVAHDDGTDWLVDDSNTFVEPVNAPLPIDPTIAKVEAVSPDDALAFKLLMMKYDLGGILNNDIAQDVNDIIDKQAAISLKAGE